MGIFLRYNVIAILRNKIYRALNKKININEILVINI